jgi:hypothetical protein
MFDEDVSEFFSDDDFTVKAQFGSEIRDVLVDLPEEIIAGDRVISGEFKITYKTGYFSGLQYGSAITVGGVSYTVNTAQAVEDGALTVAYLSKA